MWLIPIVYIGLGVLLVVMRREQKNPLDVLFAIVFWPMHITFVEDEVDFDDRFARFLERLSEMRAQSDQLQQTLSRHEAATGPAHRADVERAREDFERLSQRVARLEELEKRIALQLELQRVMPTGHAADVAMLLADAETELDVAR